MIVGRFQNRADTSERTLERTVAVPVDRGSARGRMHETEQDPQGGRLACSIRTEEAGDAAVANLERQSVDGRRFAIALPQIDDLDHVVILRRPSAVETLDEAVDAARLRHVGDLQIAGDDRPVPEEAPCEPLLDLDRAEAR